MLEKLGGRGKLRSTSDVPPKEFEVEYSFEFEVEMRTVRSGLPPVPKHSARVLYLRAVDGKAIPQGEYILEAESEYHRVKNLGANNWHYLAI